jgi:flagellar secretion chaperone FliS
MSALPQNNSNAANAYLKTRVMTATPEELRLMLLDGAIKFGKQGREGLVAKNYEQTYLGLSQCRDIILELMTSIRVELNPELANNIRALYSFIYTQLIEGTHEKDIPKIDKAIELIEFERETWVMLMEKLADERSQLREQGVAGSIAASMAQPTQHQPVQTQAPLSIQG